MNRHELVSDAAIRDAFERQARRADAAGLHGMIIRRTAAMPQRRAWVVELADLFERRRTRHLVLLVAIVALLSALLVGLLIAGGRPPGLKAGLGAYISGGDVYLEDPDWTSAVKILDDPDVSFTRVTWVDGGRRLAVEDGTAITILDPASGERTLRRADASWLRDVTWSADGGSFAYAENVDPPPGRVVIVDSRTGDVRRLTADQVLGGFGYGYLEDPTMSPDGRWLAVVVAGGRANSVSGDGVARIDTRTGAATWIIDGLDGRMISDLAWSPDSTRLVYEVRTSRYESPDGRQTPGVRRLVMIGADGSNPAGITRPSPEVLPDGSQHLGDRLRPSWSPDGRWIAFRTDPGLSVVRADGSERRDLVQDPVGWFTWSPDGRRIEFVRTAQFDDASGSLWDLDLTSGEARALGIDAVASVAIQAIPREQPMPGLAGVVVVATPSPSARMPVAPAAPSSAPPADPAAAGWSLLIRTDRTSDCYMAALGDLSTGALQPLTGCVSGAQPMDVSPDGHHVLFMQQGHLVVQDLMDGRQQEIPHSDGLSAYDHAYHWSPRGGWFSWTICPSRSSCTTSILPADGTGEPRTLTVRYQTEPSWSPNEARLVYETPDGLVIANGDGSASRPLGVDISFVSDGVPSIAGWPPGGGWSPDGGQLAYIHDGNVWVVEVDGTGAHALTDFEFGGIDEVAWSPDGQRLAIVHGATVWLVALDGSRVPLDPGQPGEGAISVTWAPNGRVLAVDAGDITATTTSLVPLDGRSPTVLPDGASSMEYRSYKVFSPDSRFIAYVGRGGGVMVANADGSGAHRVLGSISATDSLTWVNAPARLGG